MGGTQRSKDALESIVGGGRRKAKQRRRRGREFSGWVQVVDGYFKIGREQQRGW